MTSKVLIFFKYALPLALAVLLMAYLFRNISVTELLRSFQRADYTWAVGSAVALLGAHLCRAYRWNLLLRPLGYRPALGNTFLAVMVGYFANLLVPRMGEVTRCGFLQRMERIPLNTSFGTVVAERLFDLVSLLVLLLLNFVLEFNRLSGFFTEFFASKFGAVGSISTGVYLAVVGLAITGLVGLVLLYRNRQRFSGNAFYDRVRSFVKGMLDGVLSIRKLDRKWDFLLQTVLIWVGYYLASYLLTFALPDAARLGPLAGLTVLIMGAIGMAAPVQGGTGSFHLLVSGALLLYGWKAEDGLILATFIWASQTLLTLVAGGVCFLISLFIQKPDAQPLTVTEKI
ncbi:MAG: flippase-like domain-containing protein [Cytophagales bacterium]|nr:flippase-like domain-containing protein [Cytophagales bacterium]